MGSVGNKYRVHEVAKDFGIPTKKVTEILTQYAETPKNHMQVLEDRELSLIFEYLTQHNQVSGIQVIFAEGAVNTAFTAEAKKAALDAAVANYTVGNIDGKALAKVAFNDYKAEYSEQFVSALESRSRAAFENYYAEEGNIDFKGEFIETKFARFAHVARGGRPTCFDRVVAGHMGEDAVRLIAEGKLNRVVCVHDGRIADMDMIEAISVDSFYRKLRKTGVMDQAVFNALTPEQKKMFDFRMKVSESLMATAKSLSEI